MQGEGIIGLTRGFMFAGSDRIVASLWKVLDSSTAELMSSFYNYMLTEELSPPEALRQAQLEMIANKKRPYAWATFTIQGEWQD